MTPTLLHLDDRTLPAVQVWYGGEVWVGTHAVTPFEDWHGPVQTLAVETHVYVAGLDGAGPRVAVFDARTGERSQPDYFADDPESRRGVAFVVPVDPVRPVPDAPLDAGTGFTVYVDFETARGDAWKRQVFDGIADQLVPLGVHLTTTRPDALPNSYGTLLVGDWTFIHAGGAFPGPTWDTPVSDYTARTVWVGDYPDPAITIVVGVHEFGHAWGLPHVSDPNDVMAQTAHAGARLSKAEAAQIRERLDQIQAG